jgi:GWxTD domain-containing protein
MKSLRVLVSPAVRALRAAPAVAAVVAALALATGTPAHAADPAHTARTLYESAVRRLNVGTPEQRQLARGELERAVLLDPVRMTYAVKLARLYYDAEMFDRARAEATRALAIDATNDEAEFLLGALARKDWLVNAEPRQFDLATLHLARSLRDAPRAFERVAALVSLLVDAGELDHARVLAEDALDAAPNDPLAQTLAAYVLYRNGEVEHAAQLFARAIPALPAGVRQHFEDVEPLLTPWMTLEYRDLSAKAKAGYAARFWANADPDPVTQVNEAQIEFRARVAHAYFTYSDAAGVRWDLRAKLYSRLGAPAVVEAVPPLMYGGRQEGDWQRWTYPELGLRVWMQAQNALGGFYEPFTLSSIPAMPFPDSLARRRELQPVNAGWAVFPKLPPGVTPLDVECAVARFVATSGPSLLVNAECPGSAVDSMWVDWVVLDSTRAEVARASRAMSPSACDPTESRVAAFTAGLAPGRYRVGVEVHDAKHGMGVQRRDVVIEPVVDGLATSDLVVTCGTAEASTMSGPSVRVEPNASARIAPGAPLTAYFEIYHLARGAEGAGRIEYDCTVRADQKDRRGWLSRAIDPLKLPPPIEVRREAEVSDSLRRQFVSVNVATMPPGRYVVELHVRDLLSGEQASSLAAFTLGK